MGVEERDGRVSASGDVPGAAKPPINGSDPFDTGKIKIFSELDGLRLEEPDGVLLREEAPSGPREEGRGMSSRGRSEREERESRSAPSERF